ncbi:MFS transporter [Streptomyces sp. NPDC018610]|uniref:MFS transporter n=1 Tax=Streptomyces sp. NPDC018610 TaxID=3365049 RepID=UPI003794ACD6
MRQHADEPPPPADDEAARRPAELPLPPSGPSTAMPSGQGTVPAAGPGAVPSRDPSTEPPSGPSAALPSGPSTVPPSGQGTVPAAGPDAVPSRDPSTEPPSGRATAPGAAPPTATVPGRRPAPVRGDLRILWWVNAVDALGSQASGLVFPLLLLQLGHGPGVAGAFAGAAALTGVVLGPLVAVPADRGKRRRIMTTSAALAALSMGTLALVSPGRPALWLLISLALVERLCAVAYEAAAGGALVRLATADELPRAAAGLQAGDQAALVAGPALGGALFQLARPVPFLADALSYAVAALGVRAIRTPLDPPPLDPSPTAGAPADAPRPPGRRLAAWGRACRGWAGDARAGLATVAGSPVLRMVLVWTSTAGGTLTLLFYTALFRLGRDGHSAATGLVLAASGAAGLLGSLLAAPAIRRLGAARVLMSAAWLLPVPCASLLWADGAWGWGAAFAGLSLLLPLITVVLSSLAVARTPRGVQSRVASVLGSVSALAAAGAPVAAAALVTVWDTRAPVLLCTALSAVLALYTRVRVRTVFRTGAPAATAGPGTGAGHE